jgi:hypothetical protein
MTPEENTAEVNPLMNGAEAAPENQEATPEVEATEEAQADSVVETSEEAPNNVPEPTPEYTQPEPEAPAQETAHAPQAVAPTEDDKVRYENRVHRMKKVLQEQPQVQFMIPLGVGEKKGAYDTVQINGYKLTIMKGAMVTVPQQVADLLAAKYEVEMSAGADHRVDTDDAKTDALS